MLARFYGTCFMETSLYDSPFLSALAKVILHVDFFPNQLLYKVKKQIFIYFSLYNSLISIASKGHTSTQLSHSLQLETSTTSISSSTISNTSIGQILIHAPHPSHLSLLTVTRYTSLQVRSFHEVVTNLQEQ